MTIAEVRAEVETVLLGEGRIINGVAVKYGTFTDDKNRWIVEDESFDTIDGAIDAVFNYAGL